MKFLVLLIMGLVFLMTWGAVARWYTREGHSRFLGSMGGALSGLLAAGLVLLVLTPKEGEGTRLPGQSMTKSMPSPPAVQNETVAVKETNETPPASAAKEEQVPVSQPPAVRQPPPAEEKPTELAAVQSLPDEPAIAAPVEPQPSLSAPAEETVAAIAPEPQISPPAESSASAPKKKIVKGPFDLRLTGAAKEVWIKVSVDGGETRTIVLKQGETVNVPAKRKYRLSVDDAGGVRAHLNGKPLPKFGPSGRYRQNIKIP